MRHRLQRAQRDPEHDALGKQIIVPDLRQPADGTRITYTEGVVTEVHLLDGDEPDIVTVDLDDGDRFYLDMTPKRQKMVEEGKV